MTSTPVEKAGNAGAIEETSYELGAVLGVAILGSISALLYRFELDGAGVLGALDAERATEARESLGAAVGIAHEAGLPEIAHEAGIAFTHSLQLTGLIGGALMLAVAALVYVLTPKGYDVSNAEH